MPAGNLDSNPIPFVHAFFVRRLGPHHFAHLRAVAEGLDITDCARRYLGVEHGLQTRAAHQQANDAVRAVARRRRESAWRWSACACRRAFRDRRDRQVLSARF